MQKEIIFDDMLYENIKPFSYSQIDEFMQTVNYASNTSKMYINQNVDNNNALWEWLYSHDNEELNDVKRELMKLLIKLERINNVEINFKTENVGKNIREKVIIAGSNNNPFGFCTRQEYLQVIRIYLSKEQKDEYIKDLAECFPNLYFVEDIGTTINTLNRKFDEIKEEIVFHLSKIDGYKSGFIRLRHEGKSNQEICEQFKSDTGIDCSPQAGREGVRSLRLVIFNDDAKANEEIVCELHTKFKKFNIDRKKQDRIYFHPGKDGIKNGRVIIKHIGKHL